jgi:hypothetical protein
MNNYYLVISSLLLLLPILLFLRNKNKNINKNILATLLFINLILSILFWSNPIENSFINHLDALFARISFVIFTLYFLLIPDLDFYHKILFFIFLFISLLLAKYSKKHSNIKWLCNDHIKCHCTFHLVVSLGCCIAFV